MLPGVINCVAMPLRGEKHTAKGNSKDKTNRIILFLKGLSNRDKIACTTLNMVTIITTLSTELFLDLPVYFYRVAQGIIGPPPLR